MPETKRTWQVVQVNFDARGFRCDIKGEIWTVTSVPSAISRTIHDSLCPLTFYLETMNFFSHETHLSYI